MVHQNRVRNTPIAPHGIVRSIPATIVKFASGPEPPIVRSAQRSADIPVRDSKTKGGLSRDGGTPSFPKDRQGAEGDSGEDRGLKK
jgi:hypothetical protein